MSRTLQLQSFLLVLIMGFLAGPRVMEALQRNEPIETGSGILAIASQGTDPLAETTSPSERKISAYDNLGLEAKSVYVWDIQTQRVLYHVNANTKLPLASVTKIMMALVAVELLPESKQITIDTTDLLEEGDSGLFAGEKWPLSSLLKFTLVTSSNDGASAIASVAGASLTRNSSTTDPFTNKKLFIEKMNEKSRAIGLTDTYFSNESGLDIDSVTSGAYGTTRDMAMLFEYIYHKHPDLFTPTTYAQMDLKSDDDIVHHVANTNEGVSTISGLIGSKTGYTDLAGGNLVVLVDIGIGHPVVIAVLGSSRTGRFSDVEKLITATVQSITGETPTEKVVEQSPQ